MRKRQIKKYGNTWIIKLVPSDIKDFELQEGDEVDIEDVEIIKSKKGRKKDEPRKNRRIGNENS